MQWLKTCILAHTHTESTCGCMMHEQAHALVQSKILYINLIFENFLQIKRYKWFI